MTPRVTRNLVTFTSSSFNTTEAKPYFIHPTCFGDDIANWLIYELKFRDIRTYRKPSQRDYGWYFLFSTGLTIHRFSLTFIPFDEVGGGEWLGCVERCAFLGLILGKSARAPDRSAVDVIHRLLSASSLVQNIQWYAEEELNVKYESASHFLT
jgi:hypothetical protein